MSERVAPGPFGRPGTRRSRCLAAALLTSSASLLVAPPGAAAPASMERSPDESSASGVEPGVATTIPGARSPQIASLTLDLVPFVASAVAGGLGGAIQAGYGWDREHVRLVLASTLLPESYRALGEDGDEVLRHRLTAVALIYDHFFRDGFEGVWLGGGIEMWVHQLDVADFRGAEVREESAAVPMATLGLGYVWRLGEWFFVNPWAAAHLELIDASSSSHDIPGVWFSASLKLGAYFGL